MYNIISGCEDVQPFLKWPGGKRWFVSKYKCVFQQNYNVYFEPFLGGGSAFFYLMPNEAVISDINQDLINVYQVMAKKSEELWFLLKEHQSKHCHEYYYKMRANMPINPLERAACFLYLNKTCFNGMYRVNKHGEFNVPIGTRNFIIDELEVFNQYAKALQHAHICSLDFEVTIQQANEGDLIFADPPYTIDKKQNSFIKYNEKLFSWDDQIRLFKALVKARERGVKIISTNAAYPELQEMYSENGFFTQTLSRFSSISGNKNGRGLKEELLITSYPYKNSNGTGELKVE